MAFLKYDIDKNAQYQQITLNSVDAVKTYTDHVYEGLKYAENYNGITTAQDAIDVVNKMYVDNQIFISPGVFVVENDINTIDTNQGIYDRTLINKNYLDKIWRGHWIQKKYSVEEFFYDTQFDEYNN